MTTPRLDEIRRQLRDRFPAAHGITSLLPVLQEAPKNVFEVTTFPAGAISEIIPVEGEGLALWIAGLLAESEETAEFPKFILIDGGDHFDPASHAPNACSQLLWVRCSKIDEALKAADLLVRDANVPFVILDLCGLPLPLLRGIPTSAWWRLKLLCETGACRLVVLVPSPLVPCATLRLSLSVDLALEDFDRPRSEILKRVTAYPNRLRRAT